MNLYEKKKSKKGKAEFTQSGPDVTYDAGEANSKKRQYAIDHMVANSGGKAVKMELEKRKQQALGESLIVDYLIAEEFASSEKSAEAIMRHMSEEWLEHILSESSGNPEAAEIAKYIRGLLGTGKINKTKTGSNRLGAAAKAAEAAKKAEEGKQVTSTGPTTKLSKVRIG